eukprot:3711700-Rhodomonas_salina.1
MSRLSGYMGNKSVSLGIGASQLHVGSGVVWGSRSGNASRLSGVYGVVSGLAQCLAVVCVSGKRVSESGHRVFVLICGKWGSESGKRGIECGDRGAGTRSG